MLRFDVGGRRGLVLALLGTVWCGTARAETRTPPPAGHLRALAAYRVAAAPVIDGALSDPAWSLGPTADGFWVSQMQRPPTDQTRVVVLYDDQALYFAITCLDGRPDLIRAAQITRDSSPASTIALQLSSTRSTTTDRSPASPSRRAGRSRTRLPAAAPANGRASGTPRCSGRRSDGPRKSRFRSTCWSSTPALIPSGSISAATRTGRASGVNGRTSLRGACRRRRAT